MLLLAVIGMAAAFALFTYNLLAQIEERSVVRASLRQLEGYEVENVRERELLNPLRERAIAPVVGWLTGLGRRLTPVGYVESTRRKLLLAGKPGPEVVDRFLAVRVL